MLFALVVRTPLSGSLLLFRLVDGPELVVSGTSALERRRVMIDSSGPGTITG